MLIKQETTFAKAQLQKEPRLRWEILEFSALLLAIKLLEIFAAALFLRLRQAAPSVLLTSDQIPWRLIQLCLAISGGLLTIRYRWRLWLHASASAEMIPRQQQYRKRSMLQISLQNALLRILLFQSVPISLFAAYQLAKIGSARTESSPWLFGAIQLVFLAVLLFLFWIYVCMGLWCAPFLWLAFPETPLWRIPWQAMHVMRGRRLELIAMLAWYGLQMLPLVTIPWVLPQAVTAAVSYFHIQIRQAVPDRPRADL